MIYLHIIILNIILEKNIDIYPLIKKYYLKSLLRPYILNYIY